MLMLPSNVVTMTCKSIGLSFKDAMIYIAQLSRKSLGILTIAHFPLRFVASVQFPKEPVIGMPRYSKALFQLVAIRSL